MRGKGSAAFLGDSEAGITPAYAGKSFSRPDIGPLREDHPRLCGEKSSNMVLLDSKTGSPPPMRGKEKSMVSAVYVLRITPAYAGKSPPASDKDQLSRDHPRLCGEKYGFSSRKRLHRGSPPPMRGKVRVCKS